ncbi:hypothetical protein AYI68_g3540 [Smittium mucronatum]|uniref:Lipoprotein n=1 Tax=Smittium mucronatum TaxID=133383 RepID=A0A1R0GZL5_9FUNG|nr:hypothetical protein AYI68_g3540 [Smittium mucronatum]
MKLSGLSFILSYALTMISCQDFGAIEGCSSTEGGPSIEHKKNDFLALSDKDLDFMNRNIVKMCGPIKSRCALDFYFGKGKGKTIEANLSCYQAGYPQNMVRCMLMSASDLRSGKKHAIIKDFSISGSDATYYSKRYVSTNLKKGERRVKNGSNFLILFPEYPLPKISLD